MTRQLKAFTLIECIIAMAILAISTMLLVQAYSALASVSKSTDEANNSIYLQMGDTENIVVAEKKTGGVEPKKITESAKKDFVIKRTIGSDVKSYSAKVDVYVVNPYGLDDVQLNSTSADAKNDYYDRYIYFHS